MEEVWKFEMFMRIKRMENLSLEQKADKLKSYGISYYVIDGNLIFGQPVTDEGSPESDHSNLSIMQCMSGIIDNLTIGTINSEKFNSEIFNIKATEIAYVSKMCGISERQVVILACIIEHSCSDTLNKEELATQMGMSYIQFLSYDSDLRALHEKKLILTQSNGDIHLPEHVIPALIQNVPYQIPDFSDIGTAGVVKTMKTIFRLRNDDKIDMVDMMSLLDELMENNSECHFVEVATMYKILGIDKVNYMERLVFYYLVYLYLYEDDDSVRWNSYNDIVEDECDINTLKTLYKKEEMELQTRGIIEAIFEGGLTDGEQFHIKDEIKEQLFEELGGLKKKHRRGESLNPIPVDKIQAKDMFYNPEEERQISRLSCLLKDTTYRDICNRLKDSGLRTGFSCIFYGSPGTGKTETVMQLAKSTGREVVQVNIAEIRSCWVGESEKNIKTIFNMYRSMVNDSAIAPILLFNEADAIFGIRKESATDSVDKMENTVQNIILQEMEKMDGILIATTNLSENLDKAFERRFLYKIKFEKPSVEAKGKIWKSMLPYLSELQADELARGFDLSGGQIENVSRKRVIQSIIDGKEPDFEEIKSYCEEEIVMSRNRIGRRIGF